MGQTGSSEVTQRQRGRGEVTCGSRGSRKIIYDQTGSGEVTCGSDREWQAHRVRQGVAILQKDRERGEIIPKSNSHAVSVEVTCGSPVRQEVARSHKVTLEVGRSRKVIPGVARSPMGQTGSGKVTENRTGW